MHTLTNEQQAMLIEIIYESCGPGLGFDEFTDVLLGLFEDIPGFETTTSRRANRLIAIVWSKYHEQEPQEN